MEMRSHDDIVSIIMVTWGRLPYTKICLESLLKNPGHKKIEVIVVDNNSQDGTAEYLCGLRSKIPFLTLILNNINLGKAGALNRGFRIATGDYFLTTDNDALYRDNWLNILLNVYKANPDVGAICTTDPAGQAKQRRYHECDDFTLDKKSSGIVNHSIFFSREVLEKIGNGYIIPPNLCKGADGLFSNQVLKAGYSLARFKHYLNYNIDQPDHPMCRRYSSLWEETKECWQVGKGVDEVDEKKKNEMKMLEEHRWYDRLDDLKY